MTIARPFILLSWSCSESTNTICFSSPSSTSFFFHFSPRLQLMHLFRGLLLFFKDTHRGHSCRSNHQSPSTLLLLPSTTVFTLCFYPLRGLCFFSFGNDDKTAADCKSSLFVSFNSCPSRKDTLVNKYDIKFRCKTGKTSLFFKSPFCVCNRPFISPLGFLLSDPCAHSSQSYHSSHDT